MQACSSEFDGAIKQAPGKNAGKVGRQVSQRRRPARDEYLSPLDHQPKNKCRCQATPGSAGQSERQQEADNKKGTRMGIGLQMVRWTAIGHDGKGQRTTGGGEGQNDCCHGGKAGHGGAFMLEGRQDGSPIMRLKMLSAG